MNELFASAYSNIRSFPAGDAFVQTSHSDSRASSRLPLPARVFAVNLAPK